MNGPRVNYKVRIRFSKHGKIRFTSHRDVARLMERALRKVQLLVAYTEGFSPRPKLSFGLALPVGHESEAEYLDVDFATPVDLEDLPERLTASLPDGLIVTSVAEIQSGTKSLQEVISSCRWEIEVLNGTTEEVTHAVSSVLSCSELNVERERKGKTSVVDIRPTILNLEVMGPTSDGVRVAAELATEKVSIRPAELVAVIGSDFAEGRVSRTHQWTIVDGARMELAV